MGGEDFPFFKTTDEIDSFRKKYYMSKSISNSNIKNIDFETKEINVSISLIRNLWEDYGGSNNDVVGKLTHCYTVLNDNVKLSYRYWYISNITPINRDMVKLHLHLNYWLTYFEDVFLTNGNNGKFSYDVIRMIDDNITYDNDTKKLWYKYSKMTKQFQENIGNNNIYTQLTSQDKLLDSCLSLRPQYLIQADYGDKYELQDFHWGLMAVLTSTNLDLASPKTGASQVSGLLMGNNSNISTSRQPYFYYLNSHESHYLDDYQLSQEWGKLLIGKTVEANVDKVKGVIDVENILYTNMDEYVLTSPFIISAGMVIFNNLGAKKYNGIFNSNTSWTIDDDSVFISDVVLAQPDGVIHTSRRKGVYDVIYPLNQRVQTTNLDHDDAFKIKPKKDYQYNLYYYGQFFSSVFNIGMGLKRWRNGGNLEIWRNWFPIKEFPGKIEIDIEKTQLTADITIQNGFWEMINQINEYNNILPYYFTIGEVDYKPFILLNSSLEAASPDEYTYMYFNLSKQVLGRDVSQYPIVDKYFQTLPWGYGMIDNWNIANNLLVNFYGDDLKINNGINEWIRPFPIDFKTTIEVLNYYKNNVIELKVRSYYEYRIICGGQRGIIYKYFKGNEIGMFNLKQVIDNTDFYYLFSPSDGSYDKSFKTFKYTTTSSSTVISRPITSSFKNPFNISTRSTATTNYLNAHQSQYNTSKNIADINIDNAKISEKKAEFGIAGSVLRGIGDIATGGMLAGLKGASDLSKVLGARSAGAGGTSLISGVGSGVEGLEMAKNNVKKAELSRKQITNKIQDMSRVPSEVNSDNSNNNNIWGNYGVFNSNITGISASPPSTIPIYLETSTPTYESSIEILRGIAKYGITFNYNLPIDFINPKRALYNYYEIDNFDDSIPYLNTNIRMYFKNIFNKGVRTFNVSNITTIIKNGWTFKNDNDTNPLSVWRELYTIPEDVIYSDDGGKTLKLIANTINIDTAIWKTYNW